MSAGNGHHPGAVLLDGREFRIRVSRAGQRKLELIASHRGKRPQEMAEELFGRVIEAHFIGVCAETITLHLTRWLQWMRP